MKKLWDVQKGLSNLEPEGQGQGIIMGVTRLLLLWPFYTIQTRRDKVFWRGVYIYPFFGLKPLSAPLSNLGPAERGAKAHQEKEMGNTFAFATICSTETVSSIIAIWKREL